MQDIIIIRKLLSNYIYLFFFFSLKFFFFFFYGNVEIIQLFIEKITNFTAGKRPKKSQEGLITWKKIETKMPWSLMFLLGGGFAIAKGSIESCMAKRVGMAMLPLRHLPPVLILTLVGYFVSTITEFTSNVGIANITLPVIAQMVRCYVFLYVYNIFS